MRSVQDPYSGLQFIELSHEWGHGAPSMPGDPDAVLFRSVKHAQHGVMATRLKMVMHAGTHMNAPVHLVQRGAAIGEIGIEHLFGNGVILSIPKSRWGLVTAEDLAAAKPQIQTGDFVAIVTGWHHKYSDSLEYFGESPGLSKDGAEWLVDRGVMLLAMDTPQIDHPLATSLGNHRGGPLMNRVVALYRRGGVLGSAQGCNNLADLYHEGVGVPGDPARAAALFRRAYRRVFKPACSSQ